MKRYCESQNFSDASNKRQKFVLTDDQRLNDFNEWMSENGFQLNKVSVTRKGVSSGWGMIANKNIESGEILFTVPHLSFLAPENSELKGLIEAGDEELKSNSGWVPLLIVLMYEYTKEQSKWRPYFNMVTDIEAFDLPLFWDEDEIDIELKGTSLKEAVVKDVTSLTSEFNSIVIPFITKHPTLFDPSKITLELFKKMVAFVLAYSFTKPMSDDEDTDNDDDHQNPPIMVPLADILNHVSRNNACLEFKDNHLEMIAIRDIMQGEEVYNTYGELSNSQLLQMYGFAEEPSEASFDTVDASAHDLYNIWLEDGLNEALLERKWNFLVKTACIPMDGYFVLGHEGVLTEEPLLELFRVLPMSEKEFEIVESNDGWLSDDENYETSLSIENIPKLNPQLKKIMHRWADLLIKRFPKTLDEEELFIRNAHQSDAYSLKSRRKLFSSYVRYGQMSILEKFKECTK